MLRLPGWDSGSYGYHGDDGNVFVDGKIVFQLTNNLNLNDSNQEKHVDMSELDPTR